MAVDVFLKLGDIAGESQDSKHAREIEVLAWSWGMSNTGSPSAGGGGGAGKVNFNDLTLTHTLDKASPLLMKACATGQHIKEGTLAARKAGRGQQEYLIIKMSDILVTSVQSSGSGEQPTESVSLQFGKVDLQYTPQKADVSLDEGVRFTYDLKTNRVG